MSKFLDRLIVGIILVLVLIIIFLTNNLVLFLSVLFISSIAIIEMANALKKLSYNVNIFLAVVGNLFIMLFTFMNKSELVLLTIVFSMIISMIISIFIENYGIDNQFSLVFINIFISLFFSFLIKIPNRETFLWIFILAWGTDTFAYVFGRLLGRHKLTEISPNKTIEGAIGGIIGALVLTLIYFKILGVDNLIKFIFFAIIAGIISQLGDISASYIKRKAGIKDYGHILRGHGGILDRFDSVLFLSPLVYLFTLI